MNLLESQIIGGIHVNDWGLDMVNNDSGGVNWNLGLDLWSHILVVSIQDIEILGL